MTDPMLAPWSDSSRRAYLPALIAACYAGDRGLIIDLCESEDLAVSVALMPPPAALARPARAPHHGTGSPPAPAPPESAAPRPGS